MEMCVLSARLRSWRLIQPKTKTNAEMNFKMSQSAKLSPHTLRSNWKNEERNEAHLAEWNENEIRRLVIVLAAKRSAHSFTSALASSSSYSYSSSL